MRIGYARVSTVEQHVERQQLILQELGAEKTFVDVCSGKNTDRPALKEMIAFAREGDTVVVESISRLARNTKDLLLLVENLQERGIEFISQKENIESTTNTGRFILTVFGAIAELERDFILQRQQEGIEIAKLAGVYKGRKPLDCPDFDKVYQQVELGKISATEAFRQLNVSKSTYYRRVRERQRSAGNQASE